MEFEVVHTDSDHSKWVVAVESVGFLRDAQSQYHVLRLKSEGYYYPYIMSNFEADERGTLHYVSRSFGDKRNGIAEPTEKSEDVQRIEDIVEFVGMISAYNNEQGRVAVPRLAFTQEHVTLATIPPEAAHEDEDDTAKTTDKNDRSSKVIMLDLQAIIAEQRPRLFGHFALREATKVDGDDEFVRSLIEQRERLIGRPVSGSPVTERETTQENTRRVRPPRAKRTVPQQLEGLSTDSQETSEEKARKEGRAHY